MKWLITFVAVTTLLEVSEGRHNIALRKRAYQSSTGWGGPAYKAVDGNSNGHYGGRSCTHTHYQRAWWEVDFGRPRAVCTVAITNRFDCCWGRLWHFDIFVGNYGHRGGHGNAHCRYVRHVGRGTAVFRCSRTLVGRYLTIRLRSNNYLTLCEVKVYSPVNLAFAQPTAQINTAHHGISSRAVDGNIQTFWRFGSCTHTRYSWLPWWRVDLQGSFYVKAVEIYNRGDCCGGWLSRGYVMVGYSTNYHGLRGNSRCGYFSRIQQGKAMTIDCRRNLRGRFVYITLWRRAVLMLCEVKVYGTSCNTQNRHVPRTHNGVVAWAKRFAPRIYQPRGEKYNPSSMSFFLRYVNVVDRAGRIKQKNPTVWNLGVWSKAFFLESKYRLRCPSCTNLWFFRGERPANKVPAYAFYRRPRTNYLDIIYYFFYPYNRGKRVCIGIRVRNLCLLNSRWGCLHRRINGCLGGYKSFGHHVGDWEHISLRFINNYLHSLYVSAHSFGGLYRYYHRGRYFYKRRNIVRMLGTHPVLYAAHGSHGLWHRPGRHVYKRLCNGEYLTDYTSRGEAWDTWRALRVVKILKPGSYRGANNAFNFKGHWGNRESGCGLTKKVTGVCVLEGAPDGPAARGTILKAFPLTRRDETEDVSRFAHSLMVENGHLDETVQDNDEVATEVFDEHKIEKRVWGRWIRRRLIRRPLIRRRLIRRRLVPIRNIGNKIKNYVKKTLQRLCP